MNLFQIMKEKGSEFNFIEDVKVVKNGKIFNLIFLNAFLTEN